MNGAYDSVVSGPGEPGNHAAPAASVGGVALHAPGETLDDAELRQRAYTELLRQAAQRAGLLAHDDPAPEAGVISEAAASAIEAFLEREITIPEPGEEDCRRHFAASARQYAHGERVELRHVLFAVTPGVDVSALRQRAEACLVDLRSHAAGEADERFAEVARTTSNCPSGAEGGALGWLTREDCAPEFAAEVFGRTEVGVLPRLVHSRFGLHVVEVLAREEGKAVAFEAVRERVADALRRQGFATGVRQLLQLLAGQAAVEGIDLERATTPLVR